MKRQESLSQQMNEKEGKLFKRGGRMFRWTSRYFTMQGPQLIYKLNQTSTNIRGDFDLAPGCMVTEITEDYIGTIKGKRIFVFWVVWPHDKHHKYIDIDNKEMMKEGEGDESDDEDTEIKDTTTGNNNTTATNNNINNNNTLKSSSTSSNNNNNHERAPLNHSNSQQQKSKNKDLVDIINSEKLHQQEKAAKAAEQIERHQIHDKNISVGAKVAAFAVGGVFVGVFTAGIGLIPYVTVAALAAVAGGGVVALQVRTQYKRPSDSRLVLACDTMNDAIAWKIAIEYQITKLDKNAAVLPANANPLVISSIIGLSQGEGFQRFEIYEGMRILAMETPLMSATGGSTISASGSVTMENTQCMKAQLVVHATPFAAFLAVMDGNNWPAEGNVKVLKSIDDHADVIEVEVMSDCRKYGGREFIKRKLCFTRFWKLDDDGIYLIALNNSTPETAMSEDEMEVEEHSEAVAADAATTTTVVVVATTSTIAKSKTIKKQHKQVKKQKKSSSSLHPVTVDAVITISPRKDNNEFDISETLVKCTCQVSTTGWEKGEMETFMTDFLKQHLLELNQHLLSRRFPMHIPPPTPSSSQQQQQQQQSLLLSNNNNDLNNIAGAVAHALNTSQESDVSNYTNNNNKNSNHNTFSSPFDNNTNNNYSNNNSSHNSSLPKRNSLSGALTSISTPSTTATTAGTSSGGMSSYHSLSLPLHDNRSHSNSNSPKRFSSSSFGVTTKQPHTTTGGDFNASINDVNANNNSIQQQKSTKSRRFMFRRSKNTAVDDSYLYGGNSNSSGVNNNNGVSNANNTGSYGMDNSSSSIPPFNSNTNNNDDNATTTISSSGRYIAAANYNNNNHHRRATSLSPSLHTSDNMIVQLPLQPINNNSRNYNNIHSNNHNNANVTSINANNTANNNNNTNIDYKKNQKLHNRARSKEASQLRDSIAMKEYTLKRIQKDILRESQQHQLILSQQLQQQQLQEQQQLQVQHTKVASSFSSSLSSSATTAGAAAIAVVISNSLQNSLNYTSTAIVELNDTATSLMQEINKLKTEYFNSTGKQFEHSVFDRTKRSSIKRHYSNNVAIGNIPSSSAKQFSVGGNSNGFRSFRMSTEISMLSESRDSYLINNGNTSTNEQQLSPQKQQCVILNSIANTINGGNNKQSTPTTTANSSNNTGTPFHWSLPTRSLRFDMLYDEENVNNNNVNNSNPKYFSSYIKNDDNVNNNTTATNNNTVTSTTNTMQAGNTTLTRARSDTVDINAKNELMVTFWLIFWIFLCVVATLFFSKFLSSF